jgi:hypothetical protein
MPFDALWLAGDVRVVCEIVDHEMLSMKALNFMSDSQ